MSFKHATTLDPPSSSSSFIRGNLDISITTNDLGDTLEITLLLEDEREARAIGLCNPRMLAFPKVSRDRVV
jgi:hypothetical protein